MSTCKIEGCTNTIWRKRDCLCQMHYTRIRRYGDPHFSKYNRHNGGICAVSGCTRPYLAKGYCELHYDRWRRNGHPMSAKVEYDSPTKHQFLRDAASSDTASCIEWKWSRTAQGYGNLWIENRVRRAHRVVLEMADGPPPTPKHCALHHCDNKACVNPKHLYWGTHLENTRDKQLRGKSQSPLTADDVRNIRARHPDESLTALAAAFGVTISAIRNIVIRKTWKHV